MDLAEIKADHRAHNEREKCYVCWLIAQLEAAHHDIDRYVQISADQATELADLRAELEHKVT